MTIYCDASFGVALLIPEVFNDVAERWLAQQSRSALAYSGWTDTEIASALARRQRSGRITVDERAEALALWRELSRSMPKADVAPGDFARAMRLVDSGKRGLRAGDALHLAVAMRSGFDLATFDIALASAAEAEGVRVALGPP